MVTTAIAFVLETLFGLFILAALVRFWMQAFRAPAGNPIAQFTMALTNWAVKPLMLPQGIPAGVRHSSQSLTSVSRAWRNSAGRGA